MKITRIALIEEMVHIKDHGWRTVRANMSRIANNSELRQILRNYPIGDLPKAQRVFFEALKRRLYLLVAILIKGNMALKRNR